MDSKYNTIHKIQDILPLTPLQRTFLLWGLSHPSSFRYYEQWRYRITGKIQIDMMRTAWKKTIEHFSILRGIFLWDKIRAPVFVILERQNVNFRVYDIQDSIHHTRKAAADDIAIKEWQDRVDLNVNPIRFSVIVLSQNECEWIISSHHILFDGWSNGLIMSYLIDCYNSLCKNQMISVESDLCLYKKHLKRTLDEYQKPDHKRFWREYLHGYSTCDTKDTQWIDTRDNHVCVFPIPDDLLKKIELFCIAHNCSLSALLYAAWAMKSAMQNKQHDIVIGATVSGRNGLSSYDMSNLIGLWIQTVPIRINCGKDIAIGDMIAKIQSDLLAAEKHIYMHNHNWLELFPDFNAIYNQMLTIQNYPIDKDINEGTSIYIEFLSSFYQVISNITVSVKAFSFIKCMEISFNTAVYKKSNIENFALQFFDLLRYMSLMINDQKISNIYKELSDYFNEI